MLKFICLFLQIYNMRLYIASWSLFPLHLLLLSFCFSNNTRFFYKQHFHKQHQAKIGETSSKS